MTAQDSFQIALNWIKDDPNLDLLMIYVSDIDKIGHILGPDSVEMMQALKYIEFTLNGFCNDIEKIERVTNMIILSDHGMSSVSKEKTIIIDEILDRNKVKYWDCGPLTSIYPLDTFDSEQMYIDLKDKIERKKLPIRIWLKEDLPVDFHISKSYRTAPILMEAFNGWTIDSIDSSINPKGLHGYNPLNNKEMNAIFIGRGPNILSGNIKDNKMIVDNTEVYGIFTKLLAIKGNPHNGTGILEKYIKSSHFL